MTKNYGLITGAAGLLGFEHAIALLEMGINPILTDINLKKLKKQSSLLSKTYPKNNILCFKMDVSKENSVENVKKKILNAKILIKILINNAAIDSKVNKNKKSLQKNSLVNPTIPCLITE